jgi:hypothetical protein
MSPVLCLKEYRSNGKEIMVRQCPVGVSVLCAVTDRACQSYGQPYRVLEERVQQWHRVLARGQYLQLNKINYNYYNCTLYYNVGMIK